ncbi:hypothetical protein AB1Y20_012885 [Prymnesium parvum]|uniref:Uncharacterized protein n=1 Tax=Prymnesium parvum TaxID=97485 RepID=A0AB34IMQ7_PRYPA
MRAVASLWGMEPLGGAQVPLVALLAFLTTAAELPEARNVAINELACNWAELTGGAKPTIDGEALLRSIDEIIGMTLPAAKSETVLAVVSQVGVMDAVSAPPPKQVSTRAMAGALGLLGPLSGKESRDHWVAPPSARESAALDQLRMSADFRLQHASSAASSHLRTALGWLHRFKSVFLGRRLFLPYSSSADVESAAYNEETFHLFGEFIRSQGSMRHGHTGEVVLSSTISDYISALRAFVSREAGYSLLVSGGNLRLPKQLLHMRREDGPAGARELSRALTARILRKLWRLPSFDCRSRRGILRWAVLWGGHNMLLRGGEFGASDRKAFSSTAGITLADVEL